MNNLPVLYHNYIEFSQLQAAESSCKPIKRKTNPREMSPEWSVNSGGRFPLQVWFIVGILHQITEVFVTNTSILCVTLETSRGVLDKFVRTGF